MVRVFCIYQNYESHILYFLNVGTTLSTKTTFQIDDLYGPAYLKASNSMFDIFQYRDVRPWLYPNFMFKLTDHYKQMMENVDVFRTFSSKVSLIFFISAYIELSKLTKYILGSL